MKERYKQSDQAKDKLRELKDLSRLGNLRFDEIAEY